MRTDGSSDRPGLLDAEGVLLYDYRFLDPDQPSGLWFLEDAESVHAVGINAVCLAPGAKWDDLSKCQEFFKAFPYLVVVVVDSTRRKEILLELRRRVPATAFFVANGAAFRGCRSVAELKATHGLKAIDEILLHTTELPAYGLVDLADVEPPDVSKIPTALSGFPILDRKLGGFYMGEMSVWTGRRGDGKSTLLSQLLNEAIDQGWKVCAYSGELPKELYRLWASLQAAGPGRIRETKDKRTGRTVPEVPQVYQEQINDWWRRKYFLYDIGTAATHDAENVLRLFRFANHAYGCKVFLVDNIMTARLQTGRDTDYYRAQSNFVAELVSFARQTQSHVHLVAHPRKTQQSSGKKHLDNDDVGGIADITNLADNVFSLERSIRAGGKGEDPVEQTTALAILKNRMWGQVTKKDEAIQLDFDPLSKRFYRSDYAKDKTYSWDKLKQTAMPGMGEADDSDLPF